MSNMLVLKSMRPTKSSFEVTVKRGEELVIVNGVKLDTMKQLVKSVATSKVDYTKEELDISELGFVLAERDNGEHSLWYAPDSANLQLENVIGAINERINYRVARQSQPRRRNNYDDGFNRNANPNIRF